MTSKRTCVFMFLLLFYQLLERNTTNVSFLINSHKHIVKYNNNNNNNNNNNFLKQFPIIRASALHLRYSFSNVWQKTYSQIIPMTEEWH